MDFDGNGTVGMRFWTSKRLRWEEGFQRAALELAQAYQLELPLRQSRQSRFDPAGPATRPFYLSVAVLYRLFAAPVRKIQNCALSRYAACFQSLIPWCKTSAPVTTNTIRLRFNKDDQLAPSNVSLDLMKPEKRASKQYVRCGGISIGGGGTVAR